MEHRDQAQLDALKVEYWDAMPGAFGVYDLIDGHLSVVYLNDGYYQMVGGVREDREKYNASANDAVHPADRPVIAHELAVSIAEGRPVNCKVRILKGDGRYGWFGLSGTHRVLGPGSFRFYAVYYDVTELMEKEAQNAYFLESDQVIIRCSGILQRNLPLKENLEEVLGQIAHYMDALDARVVLLDDDGHFRKHFGYRPERWVGGALKTTGMTRDQIAPLIEPFMRMESVRIDSPEEIRESMPGYYRVMVEEGARNVLMVPLLQDGELAGYFGLLNPHYDKLEQAYGVLNSIATNISNALLNEKNIQMILESKERILRYADAYHQELNYFRSARDDVTLRAHVDLVGNRICESIPDVTAFVGERTYDEVARDGFGMDSLDDRGRRIGDVLSRDALLRSYDEGRSRFWGVFRRVDVRHIQWSRVEVVIIESPETGDLEAFIYVADVTAEELSRRISQRMASSVYDFTAVINPADETIRFDVHYVDSAESIASYADAVEYEITEKIREEDAELTREETTIAHICEELERHGQYTRFVRYGGAGRDEERKLCQYSWLDESKSLIFVCVSDVTEQYRKEREQMRRLQEALDVAEQASASKSEFVSRISHDIRTPIGAVLNLTEFAKADMDDAERLGEDLDKIATSGRLLLSLINDVLDIAKIDSGKVELRPEPYPFDEYVSEIRNIIEPMCEEKGLACVVEASEAHVGAALVDRVRLNQITLNLLSNAVRYTPEGGTVSFRAWDEQLEEGRILFAMQVEDTGIGMSKDFQQRMFEEFEQEEDNPYRTDVKVGTGLGLPIVKKLLDLMGGHIDVQSELGKGTLIEVRIPLEVAEEAGSAGSEDAGAGDGLVRAHILLAEDNEINTMIAMRIFGELGVTLDHAADGAEAVRMFRESRTGTYDAVFMDIQMPNLNGYEATRAIRALGREDAAGVPIVAMTADAFTDAMRKAEEAGMTGFTTKPLDSVELRRILLESI